MKGWISMVSPGAWLCCHGSGRCFWKRKNTERQAGRWCHLFINIFHHLFSFFLICCTCFWSLTVYPVSLNLQFFFFPQFFACVKWYLRRLEISTGRMKYGQAHTSHGLCVVMDCLSSCVMAIWTILSKPHANPCPNAVNCHTTRPVPVRLCWYRHLTGGNWKYINAM